MNSTIETIQNLIDKKESQLKIALLGSKEYAITRGLLHEIDELQGAIKSLIGEAYEEAIIEIEDDSQHCQICSAVLSDVDVLGGSTICEDCETERDAEESEKPEVIEAHEEAIIEGQNRVFNSPIEAARQAAFTAYISVDGNLRYAAMKAYRANLIEANISCSVNSAYQVIDAMGLHAKSS